MNHKEQVMPEDRDAPRRAPYATPTVRSFRGRDIVEALGHASALYGGEEFGGGYGED